MGNLTPFRRRLKSIDEFRPPSWLKRRTARGGGRLPIAWSPFLRRRGVSAGEIRTMIWIGLILGLLGFQALRLWTAPPDPPAPSVTVAAEPWGVRVIDGDTFDYRGERIRIADIDTPETRGHCAYESALAARATRRMRALLAAGPFELVAIGRDRDRYGRKLRIVVRDGRSIGDSLVAEGLARTWTGRRQPWCA